MSKGKKKKKCEGSTDEEKANRELVALEFQAAPGASAQRSTSPLLPSLPMGPMCHQLMHGWLMTVSPGQRRAVSTLTFTWHTVPVWLRFTGELASPGSGM